MNVQTLARTARTDGSAAEKLDQAKVNTDLAVDRTVMAADNTLMAWERTGLSLISFGFTIYKFLQYSSEQLHASGKAIGTISSPRAVGLFMIGIGTLSLVLGTVENVATLKRLRERHEVRHTKYALLISGILTTLGVVLFLGIILRVSGID